jgi:hypothetical protein
MSARRSGELLDIEFITKSGQTLVIREIGIKVFDALRKMKSGEFDKHFVWGTESGIAIDSIAGWKVISQYEE